MPASRPSSSSNPDWWRGAVIYQIYPRSFMDANGDGIGDLQGIIDKLDHVASLGVDAIWLSPFFTSPMKDFGYDISDYRGVDPMFGSLEDFDRLVEAAHECGLKVTIDQVLSHSSDQHPWFTESRQNRDNPRADWYVWADPNADGTPPTNWQSVFGGSAWQWDTRRCQYYLHNFLAAQPDLNFRNPEVVDAMLEEVRFWLERGVDGFRLDAINFCTHGALQDNPPREAITAGFIGVRPDNPYGFQRHLHDKSQPENLEVLRRLRALLDEYPGTTSVGEVGDDDATGIMAEYTQGGDKLHMCYSFNLLTENHDPAHLLSIITEMEARIGDGWPCWALGNHDITRLASRWNADHAPARQRLFLAFLLTQRGSVCLYQGEELGLTEAELSFEQLVDPAGITFWPAYKGRDGCRTPMPWQADAENAGFTDGQPWLPIPAEHRPLAVDRQASREDSLLAATRALLQFRRHQPALRHGQIHYLPLQHEVICLERTTASGRLLIALNFAASPRSLSVPSSAGYCEATPDVINGCLRRSTLELPAHGIGIIRCPDDSPWVPWQ
ncbi:alpha-amylase family glycosyl hydrolase [Halomonas halmophila]|uniref:Alpha-glucosidase n=1 Tax=Halomonas halmophila TaxID=252 RepID=A0A4Y4EXX6_9GAMM|nr:alpha-amylase family glycosyl hydrolase [Halomonas halmophila]GED21145.1 alpha-glucosidase [Halomonas halmophila]